VDDVAGGAVATGAGDDGGVLADADDRCGQRVAKDVVEHLLLIGGQRAPDAEPGGLIERVQVGLKCADVGEVLVKALELSRSGTASPSAAEQLPHGAVAGGLLQREYVFSRTAARGDGWRCPRRRLMRRRLLDVLDPWFHPPAAYLRSPRASSRQK